MRSLLVAAPLLLAATTYALPEISISKRDKHNNGATNHFAKAVSASLRKRAGTVGTNIFDVDTWSSGGAYYANITVGTPPQQQTVILDTGSSDLYFDASTARTCQAPESSLDSCQGGTYSLSDSKTYQQVAAEPAFNTTFGDGSTASGPYGSDVVGLGDVLISGVQFGVANTVESTTGFSIGLMGIGYSTNEAVQSLDDFYPNMPEILRDAGVINSRLYSVYLNDARSHSGTILFGGIDKSKYTGDMATIDLLPPVYGDQTTGSINQFITTVSAATVTVGGHAEVIWSGGSGDVGAYSSRGGALPVLLDTGSTAWTIPQNAYYSLVQQFDYIDRAGSASCKHASSGDFITLEFGGKISVDVDVSNFLVPLIDPKTKTVVPYGDGSDTCSFLLVPTSGRSEMAFGVLGDAILRSMYVVYDLDNGQVSIAQANLNSTDSPDIVTVQAGPTGVADAVSAAKAPANTWSVDAAIHATVSYSVSTAQSTIGTATGAAAIPTDAQSDDEADEAEGHSSGGSRSKDDSSPSTGAATSLILPGADFTAFWITGLWIAFAAVGAGLMM